MNMTCARIWREYRDHDTLSGAAGKPTSPLYSTSGLLSHASYRVQGSQQRGVTMRNNLPCPYTSVISQHSRSGAATLRSASAAGLPARGRCPERERAAGSLQHESGHSFSWCRASTSTHCRECRGRWRIQGRRGGACAQQQQANGVVAPPREVQRRNCAAS